MPGISKTMVRNRRITPVTILPCHTVTKAATKTCEKESKRKALLSFIKSPLICSCYHQGSLPLKMESKSRMKQTSDIVDAHQDVSISRKQVFTTKKNGPKSALSQSDNLQDAFNMGSSKHIPGSFIETTMSDNEDSDDGISVISLGEGRELAQLRIEGMGIQKCVGSISEVTQDVMTSSKAPTETTMPPSDILYHKETIKAMKKSIYNEDRNPIQSTSRANTKQNEVYQQEKKQSTKKEQHKSKLCEKLERLNSWLEGVLSISLRKKIPSDLQGKIAVEQEKIAKLYKSINDIKVKKGIKKEEVEQLIANMEKATKYKNMSNIRKGVKILKKLDQKVGKLLGDVRKQEARIKTYLSTNNIPVKPCLKESILQVRNIIVAPAPVTSQLDTITTQISHPIYLSAEKTVDDTTVNVCPCGTDEEHPVSVVSNTSTTSNRMLVSSCTPNIIYTCTSQEGCDKRQSKERSHSRLLTSAENSRKVAIERPLPTYPYRNHNNGESVQEDLPNSRQYDDSFGDDETNTKLNRTNPLSSNHSKVDVPLEKSLCDVYSDVTYTEILTRIPSQSDKNIWKYKIIVNIAGIPVNSQDAPPRDRRVTELSSEIPSESYVELNNTNIKTHPCGLDENTHRVSVVPTISTMSKKRIVHPLETIHKVSASCSTYQKAIERTLTAHPYRISSTSENVQEYLPTTCHPRVPNTIFFVRTSRRNCDKRPSKVTFPST